MTPEDESYHRARFVRLDERARVRARGSGGRAERVELWAVFETAGWRCSFCHEAIDPALRWTPPPVWVSPVEKRRTSSERKLWNEARKRYDDERKHASDNNAQVASVDHLIPLWRGGAHIADNCRPAHYGCNAHEAGGWARRLASLSSPSP